MQNVTEQPLTPAHVFATYRDAFTSVFGAKFWKRVKAVICVIAGVAIVRSVGLDVNEVPSGSMIPTVLNGDRISVNKLAYDLKLPFTTVHLFKWADPRRGDVVTFVSPADGVRLVKRVVAVGGDSIELRENRLYLNGMASIYEPVAQHDKWSDARVHVIESECEGGARAHLVMGTPTVEARRSFGPVVVPAGKYFMMGDNRDDSFDSRYFGPVDRGAIVGRAGGVVASLDSEHHGLPRWGRFFKSLS